MDQTKTKTTAPDFFLYLGVIIGLYASVISLIALLFELINKWLPDVTTYYDLSGSGMRFPIAVLIIFFPVFMYLSRMSTKAIVLAPEKKEMWIRRWFSFLTLFVAGLTIAIDLAVLIYNFIGGEDLTLRFVLKVVVVLVVAAVIFRYYLYELRRDPTVPAPKRKYFAYVTWLIIVASLIFGIVAIGSPTTQRNIRLDQTRVSDLQGIQYQVVNYWQQKGVMPGTMADLKDEISGFIPPTDPETGNGYIYTKKTGTSFELCATFKTVDIASSSSPTKPVMTGQYGYINEVWQHQAEYTCFSRTIDKDLYPIRIK